MKSHGVALHQASLAELSMLHDNVRQGEYCNATRSNKKINDLEAITGKDHTMQVTGLTSYGTRELF